MLKKNGYSLSDQQVREIKANMVQGVTLTALSRMYDVSVETLSRIRRGLTYKHVMVMGEETLRPTVGMVAPTEKHLEIVSSITDEEVEASIARLNAELVKPEVQVLDEVQKMAQNLLGNTPLSRR